MKVVIDGIDREVEDGFTARMAIEQFSPYGDEALICKLNGEVIRSIDGSGDVALTEGDTLEMYPLIVGG